MTFSKAQQEFAVRYFLWGESEWKKEINESFPVLRSFKTGKFWKRYHFMQQLDRKEQLILASGLLKKTNSDAVQALGESFTTEEEALLQRLREFSLNSSGFEAEIGERQLAGEKIKFASKAKIRRAILKQFKVAFGAECFDLAIVGMDPELNFKMKWNGWIISTYFNFEARGRQFQGKGPQFHYSHSIYSEAFSEYREAKIPVVILGFPNLTGWLGLKGDVPWAYVMDEEIQSVCNFIIERCRIFFALVPKFLKGLEFKKLTSE
jgi:hypothetical protein